MKTILSICFSGLLISCGSGGSTGGEQTSPTITPVTPQTFTGTFIDSPVEGLHYVTNTLSGITNSKGEFNYLANEKVTFFIGGITFPEVDAASIITPLNLFATDDIYNVMVINALRLLQSLDSDADASNGISIPALVNDIAENITFDFSSTAYEQELTALLSLTEVLNLSAVSADSAILHFQQTLEVLNEGNTSNCAQTHAKIGWGGYFNTLAHNVSGKATIIDDCTIFISEFYYDGGGPEVYLYAANNHEYASPNAFAVSQRISETVYENSSFTIKLANGKTFDDFNGLSVWCVDFAANFGQMTFTP